MKDIKLNDDWDIAINPETADIELIDSPMQEIMIRLQWFAKEWIFAPQYGLSYWENILVKNPDTARIKNLIKKEIQKVDTVEAVENIGIQINTGKRTCSISFDVKIGEELYRKEVELHG